MPWDIPEDLARFKELTSGHAVIMGRKTFESIGRPLPNRLNIVLTRRSDWHHPDIVVVNSMGAAMRSAESAGLNAYLVGGEAIYKEGLTIVDRLEITEIELEPDGDTLFPEVDWSDWVEVNRDAHSAHSFVTYRRRRLT